MAAALRGFVSCEEGQDLVEYALVIAFVSIASVSGVKLVGTSIVSFFTNVAGILGGLSA